MIRTIAPKGVKSNVIALNNKLQALSVIVARTQLMARMGMQYDDKRNLYDALGYKLTLTYDDFAAYYERNEMAKAIINRPVESTWRGVFGIQESDERTETALEKAWVELNKAIPLKQSFIRLDKLSSLGNYGVLFLGLDDVQKPTDFANPVSPGNRKLLYVKPAGQGSAAIVTYESNSSNPRYGQPVFYDLTLTNPNESTSTTIRAHYSRILHVTGEKLESEYAGVPILQVVFNRLMDLEKLVGGSAEMFWRGARPGYQGSVDPEYTMTADTEADLKDQIDEYEHNLRRILVNSGIDLKALELQVADPKPHVDVQVQMISAVTGIPKRILTGSEIGELASSEDKSNWLSLIDSRRTEYAEPQIVRPFVDRMIEYGVFPKAKSGYSVVWEDLFAQSDKDKAEVGRIRAEALKSYTMSPTAEMVVPPDVFCEYFLGLGEDEIELIKESRETEITEEQRSMAEAEKAAKLAAKGKGVPPKE